ncbi:glycosyltransferase, partial [Streptococcus suis]
MGAQKNPHKFTSKADLFVCSSYAEGFSTACSEAIMLGVPVLTTSVSGGKEIIDTAKSGMLVGMSDEDLYESMKYVIENQKQVEEWKERLVHTKHK